MPIKDYCYCILVGWLGWEFFNIGNDGVYGMGRMKIKDGCIMILMRSKKGITINIPLSRIRNNFYCSIRV
jgi:hypothetical protein